MILKLRRQFIIVAMCSTLAVLSVIIAALNFFNYQSMKRQADLLLEILSDNNGRFPDFFMGQRLKFQEEPDEGTVEELPQKPPQWQRDSDREAGFTRETPYESRFFTVLMDSEGNVFNTDTGRIAAVEPEKAESYAASVLAAYRKNQKKKGFLDGYRYAVSRKGTDYLIIFLDRTRELQSAGKVLFFSVLVSFGGMLAVFALVLFFSKKVFLPVEESYQKQRRFITDASHELKTPLTIISANVEVMEMESQESKWSRSVKNQIDRLTALVNQMVTLSRLDEQSGTVRESFSLSDAVADTAALYLPVAENSRKKLILEIEEGIVMMGDEKQIRQMTGLLMDNAVKYAAAENREAQIRLTLKHRGKKAELILWNTAELPESGKMDILFERFYRPDRARNSADGGSGIGLSIVKSIVEAHKGRITAISKDGKSIEFRAVFPI